MDNTDKHLIEYVLKLYPSATVRHTKSRNLRYGDVWTWSVRAGDIPNILEQIIPYLIVKHRQANLLLRFYKECYPSPKDGERWRRNDKGRFHNIIDAETREKQEHIYQLMRSFNKKGHNNTK